MAEVETDTTRFHAFLPLPHSFFFKWDGVAMVMESYGGGAASWLAGRDLLNAV